jgi:hypothetical protein
MTRTIEELQLALARSDPWDKSDNDLWVCIHCGGQYDWSLEIIQEGHKKNCIWYEADRVRNKIEG